jgi:UDP-N-acetylmuramoyl-tripeptide--D-alanyl-D-alanine ligase
MDAKKLSEIVGGKLVGKNRPISGFHFDSREVEEGNVFVPIKGRRDGHKFTEDAFKRGASGVLSSQNVEIPPQKFGIFVPDTFKAFKEIALYRRRKFSGTVVGITGSVGKTTTKELVSKVLLEGGVRTYRNERSFNNELGVTYTLSNLPPNTDIYVQEIGTNSPGEVSQIREFVNPEVGIVTSVERAHMEKFKDLEELVEEKFSITEGSRFSIVPYKYRDFSKSFETLTFGRKGDVKLISFNTSSEGTDFEISVSGKRLKLFSPVPGFSIVNSSMVCGALLLILGLPLNLLDAVSSFSPPYLRMEICRFQEGVLINDSYNANPASFRNALEVLSKFPGKKVVIAGDMLELGEISREEHRKLGRLMNELGISEVIAYGEEVEETVKEFKGESYHFKVKEELLNFVSKYRFEGKAVLIKGSRANRLEEVAEIVKERFGR